MAALWLLTLLPYLDLCLALNRDSIKDVGERKRVASMMMDEMGSASSRSLRTSLTQSLEPSLQSRQHNSDGEPPLVTRTEALNEPESKVAFVGVTLRYVDYVAVVMAIWLICSAWWNRSGMEVFNFMGLDTRAQFIIFTLYVILGSGHTFLQSKAGATGYSVIAATALICALKALISVVMFICRSDGSIKPLWQATHPRFGRVPACVLLMLPGGLYAIYDVLSFMALAKVDPMTYVIIRSVRIVMLVVVWQPILRRTLSFVQVTSLFFLFLGTFTKGFDHLSSSGTTAEFNTALVGVLLILAQIAVSIVASVASEVFLKELSVDTDLQNSCQYLASLCFLLCGLCMTGGVSALYDQLLAPAAWGALWADKWMCASVAVLAAFGVVTAYFLKELSNILKELSHGFTLLVIASVEGVALGVHFTSLGLLALTLTTLATVTYNIDPISNNPSKPAPSVISQKSAAAEVKGRGSMLAGYPR